MIRITILGAGPAGLAAAWRLVRRKAVDAKITLIEKDAVVGGLSRSFQHRGLYFDMGSHRLHPACSPDILNDIRKILAGDLLLRPRNGRILLGNRFIRFPIRPINLIRNVQASFLMGMARDRILSFQRDSNDTEETFQDALINRAGKTLSEAFYFPYSKKIWGLEPNQIASDQAQVRVDALSFGQALKKIIPLQFKKKTGKRSFYYPRKGIGQITDGIAEKLKRFGVDIHLNTTVHRVGRTKDRVLETRISPGGCSEKIIPTDILLSTIPVSHILERLHPESPQAKQKALRFRSLILLYAVFSETRLTPFDAHYFPEQQFLFSRVSEPKNYSGNTDPKGLTGICMEIPCEPDDPIIGKTAEDLWHTAKKDLRAAGFRLRSEPVDILKRVMENAYPVYRVGFKSTLNHDLEMLGQLNNFASFGRCGLFVHDNLHHAMAMGYAAADCVNQDGRWDRNKWADKLKGFKAFTVED